ncbi:cell wall hydrolase [Fictibacillus sp. 5RED26]|uniref:cell wall hydrolase n=1 Tax=unclassified Fictibacillus TaxID=2644029 RepID=UPI0018CEB63D|nr:MULTISPECIES: cell wall hydrolase [unclassified Fictibacillus]MBH0155284.1 cell wall hydrolase [Fictibacillus sp. 5RED26]MBH0164934.1 cell wall hydrolase [Fictibacillus sp. 7GRE50]MBH0172469.1 cell wall hydrolase [Fictibacillus sp. 23RED33]
MRNLLSKLVLFFVALAFLFVPTKVQAHGLLTEGSQGYEVSILQEKLKALGLFYGPVTGYYGPITERAVANFQYETNLSSDGVAGPATFLMLQDVEQMARVVHGEARGESYIGKVSVAAVILNRLEDPAFPSHVSDVIHQTNAFTAVHDGQYHLKPSSYAYRAVLDAMKGWDPTYGSVYYYNPELATDTWIFSRASVTKIGNHLFAK